MSRNIVCVLMFDGLRSYFLSQVKCPVIFRKLFEYSCFKLWLSFARDQVLCLLCKITSYEKYPWYDCSEIQSPSIIYLNLVLSLENNGNLNVFM
jgi:hypothetical protein